MTRCTQMRSRACDNTAILASLRERSCSHHLIAPAQPHLQPQPPVAHLAGGKPVSVTRTPRLERKYVVLVSWFEWAPYGGTRKSLYLATASCSRFHVGMILQHLLPSIMLDDITTHRS